MSDHRQLLLIGATGYIAGVLLSHWHKIGFGTLPFQVTAAARSETRLASVAQLLGIETVTLSFDDTSRLGKEVQKYDIVVQLADCDAFEATEAIIRGMKTRKEQTGRPPLLYHASGAAFLDRYTAGYADRDEDVLTDLDTESIHQIPLSLPHRNVDNIIINADTAGYIRSYIVVPFAVFGTATGAVHEANLANPSSMPIPRLIKISLRRKGVPLVGDGRNQKGWVHVEDVVTLFQTILLHEPTDHGTSGLFFCVNGELDVRSITAVMAEELHAAGALDRFVAVPVPEPDVGDAQLRYWASTERGHAERARELGWMPRHDLSGLLRHVRDEVRRLGVR